jgi:hypothetical protein
MGSCSFKAETVLTGERLLLTSSIPPFLRPQKLHYDLQANKNFVNKARGGE